jgi:probable HAF family extracellular repeat protein
MRTLLRCRLPVLVCLLPIFSVSAAAQKPVKITLTTIDVPGATVTSIDGINKAGEMVGYYGQYTSEAYSGFLYNNGEFSYFDYPGQPVTVPGAINDSGLIVGYATQQASERFTVVGFTYDGTTFTTLQDGSDNVTYAYGVNNAGVVVGSAGTNLDSWGGLQEKSGKYKGISFPGHCTYADAFGINDLAQIVGSTVCGVNQYGYTVKNGRISSVQYPGSTETIAQGISASGTVVGGYSPQNQYIYAFAELHGKYVSFSYPGALYTAATGINASGQIVGYYTFDNQTYHGFVSSPIAEGEFGFHDRCRVAIAEGR